MLYLVDSSILKEIISFINLSLIGLNFKRLEALYISGLGYFLRRNDLIKLSDKLSLLIEFTNSSIIKKVLSNILMAASSRSVTKIKTSSEKQQNQIYLNIGAIFYDFKDLTIESTGNLTPAANNIYYYYYLFDSPPIWTKFTNSNIHFTLGWILVYFKNSVRDFLRICI
ncbi:hypothetical protein BpHYR1_023391 [Brachionus plicatilis]|uniref:Uncharacterized protein n=1 Tax=Brachionus plicatilis TaxID=10195 RepID=A0A3M7Q864_BRAPC|nr:hypothetical protein BpHYR1_023391 [Brachionus plicatilis]